MKSRILIGNVLDKLRELPDESVHVVCTSPPYWRLRDYSTPAQIWADTLPLCEEHESKPKNRYNDESFEEFCKKCGAWRGHLGLENSPELFVRHLVQIFEEVKRVLHPSGTVWLVLGDTFFGSGCGTNDYRTETVKSLSGRGKNAANYAGKRPQNQRKHEYLKPKDLAMIPARVAIALQQAGWWVVSQIPWIKRNSMPESVHKRPTTAVEYVYLLAKSSDYFYDADAVRMPLAVATLPRMSRGISERNKWTKGAPGSSAHSLSQPRLNIKKQRKLAGTGYGGDGKGLHGHSGYFDADGRPRFNTSGRNRRNSDWFFESWQGLLTNEEGEPLALLVNTSPFKGAHFATFGEKLVIPMIKAGTSEKGQCEKCGSPWEKIVIGESSADYMRNKDKSHLMSEQGQKQNIRAKEFFQRESKFLGWRPTCKCGGFKLRKEACFSRRLERRWYRDRWQRRIELLWPATEPCVVLDPFAGSGTTLAVAKRLGRYYIGIELSEKYVTQLIEPRLAKVAPLFHTDEK